MIVEDIIVATRYGPMPTTAIYPRGDKTYPGVIMLMDARGLRLELTNMAQRMAQHGYFVLLPDMYYRLGVVHLDQRRRSDPMHSVQTAARMTVTNQDVNDDVRGMLDYMNVHPRVKDGPRGIVGYCMSGQYVVSAQGTFPGEITAGSSHFGLGTVTENEDSPHLLADKIQGELFLGFAEHDRFVPLSEAEAIKKALDEQGVKNHTEIFPGTHHGYAFPERDVYDREVAEKSWYMTLEMFRRQIG